MPKDFSIPAATAAPQIRDTLKAEDVPAAWSPRFVAFKSVFDVSVALLALPSVGLIALALLILNPFFNPGPVFFRQKRMGRDQRPFRMWKFRTMVPDDAATRHHAAGVEEERITPLGRILRRTRIDEMPNFLNVLMGEMSVIGPRPDAWEHAAHYVETLPGYAMRHRVRPGITGLAQVENGYAAGMDATRAKAEYDRLYVVRSCGRLDLYIAWRTVIVMMTGFGAR